MKEIPNEENWKYTIAIILQIYREHNSYPRKKPPKTAPLFFTEKNNPAIRSRLLSYNLNDSGNAFKCFAMPCHSAWFLCPKLTGNALGLKVPFWFLWLSSERHQKTTIQLGKHWKLSFLSLVLRKINQDS